MSMKDNWRRSQERRIEALQEELEEMSRDPEISEDDLMLQHELIAEANRETFEESYGDYLYDQWKDRRHENEGD